MSEIRVFKYRIELSPEWGIHMPQGARILTVQEQRGEIVLWAEVDQDAPTVCRRFAVVGTGYIAPDEPHVYIATVQSHLGLVWHIFELSRREPVASLADTVMHDCTAGANALSLEQRVEVAKIARDEVYEVLSKVARQS